VTLQLGWLIASWLVATFVGSIVGAFTYGLVIGRWRERLEAGLKAALETLAELRRELKDAAAEREAIRLAAEGARKSREAMHRRLDGMDEKLKLGEAEFKSIYAARGEIRGLTEDIRELRVSIRGFVTRDECKARHGEKAQ